MRKEQIEEMMRRDFLRKRSLDKEKVKSMIESSTMNMTIVKTIPLTEQSAILIFRETYESIRQLGDAQWWIVGYEPRNHAVSMNVLKEVNIQEKTKLNHLDRFRNIRHDINYKGFKATIGQAKEIVEFWDACSHEIITSLLKELE